MSDASATQAVVATTFVQWKGTDVCLDFMCGACGFDAHYDGAFAYYLRCPDCGAVYEMPHTFTLPRVHVDEGSVLPMDPSLASDAVVAARRADARAALEARDTVTVRDNES